MSKEEDPFEAAINAAFANSASAAIKVDLSKATLSDLLLHSPTNSPTKLPYPRSLTSGLIAAKCIPSSTLVCTLPSPTPVTPKIGSQSLELLPTPKIGPQVSLKSISQSKTEELSFADQFFARGPSPSAPKRIRLIHKEEEEATRGSNQFILSQSIRGSTMLFWERSISFHISFQGSSLVPVCPHSI